MAARDDRTRIFVSDPSACPDGVVVRSKAGRTFYHPNGRASQKTVGGDISNKLLELEDLEKADPDERLTVEQVEALCPACARKMRKSGIVALKVKQMPDTIFKPFGPYDDFDDCVSENSDKDDPEAYCAEVHHEITGEWPGEKQMTDKVYVASDGEAPDGVELKEDDSGRLYYEKQQVYENVRATYSEEVEEELEDQTDVESNEAEAAGDGTPSEEEFEDELDDIRDQIHDVDDAEGLPVHET